ncbi:MAG: carboxypeptidase regulatory-like domain-containing protein [Verrucomicrobiota bacterium]|nr:carboxypeptidase regulatory-like domain-containing protein [Verrucomicrobiota bacterium]
MKKLFFLIGALALLGLGLWLEPRPNGNINSPAVSSGSTGATRQMAQQAQPRPAGAPGKPGASSALMEYVQMMKTDPGWEGRRPINFWGRVLDESNNPVADAKVRFQWTDLSSTGTSQADAKSDGEGFFSLTGRHGKFLAVLVGKGGYYSGRSSSGGFEYANPGSQFFFTPDQHRPIIFHLRKKGIGVGLIVSGGVLPVVAPTNGLPVFVDFFGRKVGSSGQLEIRGWKEPKDFKTAENNWKQALIVHDGGLIPENDEFPFEAPETGYQSDIQWRGTDGSPGWEGGINEKFYIKFGNPPLYGVLIVLADSISPKVYLDYAINPTGSRNLEPTDKQRRDFPVRLVINPPLL